MEKIEVTTRFKRDGSITLIDFRIQDDLIQVMDIGRHWDDDGGKHILVMDFQHQTYHLFFQLSDLTWYLISDIKPREEYL
jgi:hypothetical protein